MAELPSAYHSSHMQKGAMPHKYMRHIKHYLPAFILVLAALILRGRYFGLPDLHIDEQFYLLTGDRLLHQGAIPYVDIWDRKPVGLFLLYALIRMAGGQGLVEYQLAATGFAAATAILIAYWPSQWRTRFGGMVAGLFYLILLHKFSGFGGEAEVFLNLFTTAAAFIVASHFYVTPCRHRWSLMQLGCAAMILCGTALQIKPTSVFPGIFLGLSLLWAGWKAGWTYARLSRAALIWISLALGPTLIIFLYYAKAGLADAFLYANIYSVAERGQSDMAVLLSRFKSQLISIGLPTSIGVGLLWFQARQKKQSLLHPETGFILGWLIAGAIAFLSVGTFYNNYALILAPMTCVILAFVASQGRSKWLAVSAMGIYASYILIQDQQRLSAQQAAAPHIFKMADTITQHLNGRCLYVHRGLPIFYYLTDACLVTPYAFPDHMSLATEINATGVNTLAEVDRIISQRPAVIIYDQTDSALANRASNARIEDAIAQDYEFLTKTADDRFFAYSLKP